MPASEDARSKGSRRDSELRRLLIRPGAIGDTILSLPALEYCRAEYTEVWVNGACVPLVGFANRVRSIVSTGLDLLELNIDTPARQALGAFDSIISSYGANRPEFREAVAGLPFTFLSALPTACSVHAADFYLRQVRGPEGTIPAISVDEVQQRDSVVIHPFSGSAKKNWPLDQFRRLSGMLPCDTEWSAGPDEQLAEAVRFDDLGSLARWLAGARAYAGNDSGISHLAAAVGIPVLAIFRCTDPAVWAPRGRGPVRVLQGDPTADEAAHALIDLIT